MAHEQGNYLLRLEQQDALLFRAMSDGTMSMRVLSLQEWEDRVFRLGLGPSDDELDAVHQIFLEVAEEETAQFAGSPRMR